MQLCGLIMLFLNFRDNVKAVLDLCLELNNQCKNNSYAISEFPGANVFSALYLGRFSVQRSEICHLSSIEIFKTLWLNEWRSHIAWVVLIFVLFALKKGLMPLHIYLNKLRVSYLVTRLILFRFASLLRSNKKRHQPLRRI